MQRQRCCGHGRRRVIRLQVRRPQLAQREIPDYGLSDVVFDDAVTAGERRRATARFDAGGQPFPQPLNQRQLRGFDDRVPAVRRRQQFR